MSSVQLPPGIVFFERGWLSSNNILVTGGEGPALIDTGYATHAQQTVALVSRTLAGLPLAVIACTHLHSDHCGGNAALQRAHPQARTLIPPGQASDVSSWNANGLTYASTGQLCEPFDFDGLLVPGTDVQLGRYSWQVHAAPGHDPHSIVLFEPGSRTLISADALWQSGFGVVFPELEGDAGFDDVAATLDLISNLSPQLVIPGHGAPFDAASGAVRAALANARLRLAAFVANPGKHAAHAAKVMLKFKLLELQQVPLAQLLEWGLSTPFLASVRTRYCPDMEPSHWLASLFDDLVGNGAARIEDGQVFNA